MNSGEPILDGLWRFAARHLEWEEGDDWDAEVAWWAVRGAHGLVLIDPLVEDWDGLDRLVQKSGGCAGIIRTLHFHERSIPAVAARYGTQIWAREPPRSLESGHFDHAVDDPDQLPGGLEAHNLIRDDEILLWLPAQRALAVGDAMLRDAQGLLSMCPESWVARAGGRARLREDLAPLLDHQPEHVLVSHGPLVLGDGSEALAQALAP